MYIHCINTDQSLLVMTKKDTKDTRYLKILKKVHIVETGRTMFHQKHQQN